MDTLAQAGSAVSEPILKLADSACAKNKIDV